MNGVYDYSVYLSAGILAWTIINNTIVKLQNIFLENSNLIKKVYFPKHILILSSVLSSLIDLLINYTLLFIVLIIINYNVNYTYLFVIFVIFIQQIFVLGIGLILSVICVHFKDLNQFIQIIFPLWFWFTPIVYAKDILPGSFNRFIEWNPLYYFINEYQNIILFNQINWNSFGMMVLVALVSLLLGLFVYGKNINGISDFI
jgi:lipopolysaccharide transport system permease protein